jgi:hypothetical protein
MLACILSLLLATEPPMLLPDYEQARSMLATAVEAVNSDPEAGLDLLTRALEDLARYPEQMIDDPATLEQRTLATLTLARAYASVGDPRAVDAMDRALREAGGAEPPLERFGPATRALYEQRRAILNELGRGGLQVHCMVECRVYVDEHEVSNPSSGLLLGSRRVIVRATDVGRDSSVWTVELQQPNQMIYLTYPQSLLDDLPTREPEPFPMNPVDRGPAPLLASGGVLLGGGITLTTLGISQLSRGVVIVGNDNNRTIHILDYRAPGATLVGLGIASVAIGVTLMSLEIVRARKVRERKRLALDITPHHFGLSFSGHF